MRQIVFAVVGAIAALFCAASPALSDNAGVQHQAAPNVMLAQNDGADSNPSFDCSLARTDVEYMICGSNDLGRYDREMVWLYLELRDDSKVAGRALQSQRIWLDRRNACTDEPCLVRAYLDRIGELREIQDNAYRPSEPEQPNSASGVGTNSYSVGGAVQQPNETVVLALWGLGIAFVLLLVAGLTNSVVVFADGEDAFWTFSPWLWIGLAIVVIGSITPSDEALAGGASPPSQTTISIIFIAAGLLSLFGLTRSVLSSIRYNGWLLGPVVALFKISIGVIGPILLISAFSSRDQYTQRLTLGALIFIAVIAWIGLSLINGNRVLARRQAAGQRLTYI